MKKWEIVDTIIGPKRHKIKHAEPDNEHAFEKYMDAVKAMNRRGSFRKEKL